MEKQEIIEKLREKSFEIVDNQDFAQKNMDSEIEKAYEKVSDIYDFFNYKRGAILNYHEENKGSLKEKVNNIIDGFEDEILRQLNSIIDQMEKREEKDEENKSKDESQDISKIENIDAKDRDSSELILSELMTSLNDIKQQTSIELSSRGYSDDAIEQIINYLEVIINLIQTKQGKNIQGILQKEKDQIISKVIRVYTACIDGKTQEDKESDNFKRKISIGKSLQAQKQYVEDVLNDTKEQVVEEGQEKPDNIIDQ